MKKYRNKQKNKITEHCKTEISMKLGLPSSTQFS